VYRVQEGTGLGPPAGLATEPVAVPVSGPEADQEPGNGQDRPGQGEVERRLAVPGREQDYRRRAASDREHPVLHPAQRGHPRLGVGLVRPRGLQRVLVERAPAVGEEPAEARRHHGAHLPAGQPRAALHPEDPLIGEVVADERDQQGADQHQQPDPVEAARHRPHLVEAGQVRQAGSSGQLQQDRDGDEHGERAGAALDVTGRQPR
jgi:hypothetical protein